VHIVASRSTRTVASVGVPALRRGASVALCALLLSLLAGCGVRTAISAESDWDQEKDAGAKVLPCGYGPPCNPRDFGGQTCQGLGLQPGNLSCDPKTCFLVLTGCGKTTGTGSTGTGSPGTPGVTQPPIDTGMDAGALFGGLFGAQAGAPATPGTSTGTPMTDEDGGTAMPGFFGNGFFGGNFFGAGFFGAGNQAMTPGTPGTPGGANEQPNGVDPAAIER
jgi:hypothetical protein